jgi:hypothetical protein
MRPPKHLPVENTQEGADVAATENHLRPQGFEFFGVTAEQGF